MAADGGGGGGRGGGGGGNDRLRPGKTWRGVTRVPRRDFGNPDGRGRGVEDERVARNVIDTAPQNRETAAARGIRGDYTGEAIEPQASGASNIRRSRFRNVRRVLLNELRVLHWMRIFAVREFFEDEIRDQLSHDDQQKLRTQARLRPARLKLDQREWLLVRNLETDRPSGRVVRPVMPDGVEKRERNRVGIERDANPPPPRRSEPAPV